MKDIVIVGAGKIGSMIAEFLGSSGDYAVTVVDRSQPQLDRLETSAADHKNRARHHARRRLAQVAGG